MQVCTVCARAGVRHKSGKLKTDMQAVSRKQTVAGPQTQLKQVADTRRLSAVVLKDGDSDYDMSLTWLCCMHQLCIGMFDVCSQT